MYFPTKHYGFNAQHFQIIHRALLEPLEASVLPPWSSSTLSLSPLDGQTSTCLLVQWSHCYKFHFTKIYSAHPQNYTRQYLPVLNSFFVKHKEQRVCTYLRFGDFSVVCFGGLLCLGEPNIRSYWPYFMKSNNSLI